MKTSALLSLSLVMLILFGCSVAKKESFEKDIQVFLTSFQASLGQGDEAALKYFDTNQSRESLLKALHVLQNKEGEYVLCEAMFQAATITTDEHGTKVSIPARFSAKEKDVSQDTTSATLVLWLETRKPSFVITRLEGEAFYEKYASLSNALQWDVDRHNELKKREPIYAQAKALQQKFDSVIWFTIYKTKTYFYAVKGQWENSDTRKTDAYTMGLLDDAGNVVIPVEYEMIGTLGYDLPNIVEVKKGGKVGYFDIDTKQMLIDPAYDMIVPYNRENTLALVKKDSVYGFVNYQLAYADGFPTAKAKTWVTNFEYLPKELRLVNGSQALCEVPNAENLGVGNLAMPSYLVKTGVFEELLSGISTTVAPMGGWTESIETHGSFLQTVSDNINALITAVTRNYLEGREEFYTENRVVFMDHKNDTLAVANIPTKVVTQMKRIGPDILEITSETEDMWYEPQGYEDFDGPQYTYFKLAENGTVLALTSHRMFAQTEFIKLDSSYLSGKFTHVDPNTGQTDSTTFLSVPTLNFMRDEILASYGMRFPEGSANAGYISGNWYTPRYDKVEEFEDQLTDIDRHNLQFLEKVIALLTTKPA
ncbi:WG repeat-containing protein [Chryseolinea lacunae]|uniref:WG repeat-containing protein n=1 Tax=Chryseolinea lacunae TaxID=2801331 RepID=A0ABS1KTY6_9BACT|nr:WG repeat-containing protein [Chryseolinea lacunae]MBL0742919.1 WG repeat-containing protein [Chryseolinea lacunae]